MPPDSAQERTETPTPRRREEARENGQIGRSQDLSAAVTLLGTLLILQYAGHDMFSRLLQITQECLGGSAMTDTESMGSVLIRSLREAALMVLPVILGVMALALLISFAQVGVMFTLKPLTPSLDKLNPLKGLKRMFSARSFVHLLMGMAKMALVAAVAWWTLQSKVGLLAQMALQDYRTIVAIGADLIFTLGLRLAIVLLVLALLDFAWQRYKTEQDLKMTKEEIKEELKRMDGDPKLKARRRQVQMQMAVRKLQTEVPQADVVVTNPTHYAVAIRYDNQRMNAPRVSAKGADYMAARIREIAIAHGVPIVERPPLARALYRSVEVGQEIPADFYKAVAEVLAYVYELAGRGHRGAAQAAMN